jgi:thioredoxin-related protein
MRAIVLLLLLLSFGNANHISWLGDYNRALEQAQKEQKPMMVLLVKKDCKLCNEIIVKNFMNHEYLDVLNKKYVAVIITYEEESSYPIELFYSTVFPTLFFVNSADERFFKETIYGDDISNYKEF